MNNLTKLKKILSKINDLKILKYSNEDFLDWKKETIEILVEIYWEIHENIELFKFIKFDFSNSTWIPEDLLQEKYLNWLNTANTLLVKFIENLNDSKSEELKILENIFNKFTLVAKQLENRYWWKETIKIEVEYDVQDLLHALLKLYFEDIRDEEWNVSFAWRNSRIDFLLKNEKIMIEVKKTRNDLRDKKIWEEIILDKAKYKIHPDCEVLVCFIYDPDNLIENPRWLEKDLEEETKDLKVKVYIRS